VYLWVMVLKKKITELSHASSVIGQHDVEPMA
jgi:hypothetical protein